MDDIELTKVLTDHDNQIKSLKHRMDGVDGIIKEIHNIATSVELLAVEAKNTGEKVDKLSDKVERIENKPSENLEKVKIAVITSAITLVATTLLGAFLNMVMR